MIGGQYFAAKSVVDTRSWPILPSVLRRPVESATLIRHWARVAGAKGNPMPHLRLEYSQNVTMPAEIATLLNQLHTTLAEIGGIRIENFKSRVYVADRYFVGFGDDHNGFVHLDIRFLEGRPKEIRQKIGKQAVRLLVGCCQPLNPTLDLQITAEVRDIARACYFKHPEGTLTPLPE